MTDTTPSTAKSLIERQVKKTAPAPPPARPRAATDPGTPGRATGGAFSQAPQTPGGVGAALGGGGADAAAILNAVDEDEEGGVEAELPREFEYESDGEGGGEDDG